MAEEEGEESDEVATKEGPKRDPKPRRERGGEDERTGLRASRSEDEGVVVVDRGVSATMEDSES